MMDLRILTLLVVIFGVVYSHTTPQNDEDNFVKLFGMMTKLQEHVTNLQNQQQQLKIKVMDSMDKQNEKLSNFEAKMIDSMNKQDEKSSSIEAKVMDSMDNFEVKVDSLVKENENFEGKIQNLQETLTEQYDQISVQLQIDEVGITNNYYGCDNSTTMPPTQPPTTTMPPTEPPTTTMPPTEPPTTTMPPTQPPTTTMPPTQPPTTTVPPTQPPTTTMPPTQPPTTTMPPTDPPTTTMPPTQPPVTNAQDCTELYSNGFTSEGVYAVYPDGGEAIDVYCQDGWTLLQKRTDDSVNYTKTMEEYERGFGSVRGEHWIGLNAMHELTEQGSYTVRFELEDFDGETRWAEYTNFHVGASPSYTLMFDKGSYDGTAGDSLSYHDSLHDNHGKKFSTMDVDQDGRSDKSCSTNIWPGGYSFGGGGWWYSSDCGFTSTTGMPYRTDYSIFWWDWKQSADALKSAIIKIKRA